MLNVSDAFREGSLDPYTEKKNRLSLSFQVTNNSHGHFTSAEEIGKRTEKMLI